MKTKWNKTWVSLLVLLLFAGLALGSGESSTPERVESPPPAAGEPAEGEGSESAGSGPEIFAVGDSVNMGDLTFTVNSVRFDGGSEFFGPEDGERWLAIDCTLQNRGDDSTNLSSLLMFELVDEEHYKKDMAIFAETKGSLDGELGAGRTLRGEIAFSVGEAETGWELIFEPNVFGRGQAIFVVSLEDVDE